MRGMIQEGPWLGPWRRKGFPWMALWLMVLLPTGSWGSRQSECSLGIFGKRLAKNCGGGPCITSVVGKGAEIEGKTLSLSYYVETIRLTSEPVLGPGLTSITIPTKVEFPDCLWWGPIRLREKLEHVANCQLFISLWKNALNHRSTCSFQCNGTHSTQLPVQMTFKTAGLTLNIDRLSDLSPPASNTNFSQLHCNETFVAPKEEVPPCWLLTPPLILFSWLFLAFISVFFYLGLSFPYWVRFESRNKLRARDSVKLEEAGIMEYYSSLTDEPKVMETPIYFVAVVLTLGILHLFHSSWVRRLDGHMKVGDDKKGKVNSDDRLDHEEKDAHTEAHTVNVETMILDEFAEEKTKYREDPLLMGAKDANKSPGSKNDSDSTDSDERTPRKSAKKKSEARSAGKREKKGSPKASPKASAKRSSPKSFPRSAPKSAPKSLPKSAPKSAPRSGPRNSPINSPRRSLSNSRSDRKRLFPPMR